MERRTLIKSAVICTALATTLAATAKGQPASGGGRIRSRPFVEAGDGTRLFCRDWGEGAPVLFCHPWGSTEVSGNTSSQSSAIKACAASPTTGAVMGDRTIPAVATTSDL
jgi:hypothetical protein